MPSVQLAAINLFPSPWLAFRDASAFLLPSLAVAAKRVLGGQEPGNQDFRLIPRTATVYTRAAQNTTSFLLNPANYLRR